LVTLASNKKVDFYVPNRINLKREIVDCITALKQPTIIYYEKDQPQLSVEEICQMAQRRDSKAELKDYNPG
jgi:hypothetical protein